MLDIEVNPEQVAKRALEGAMYWQTQVNTTPGANILVFARYQIVNKLIENNKLYSVGLGDVIDT